MAQDDERIEQAKRDAFGEKAGLAQAKVVGSGISRTVRLSLDLLAAPELVKALPPPWSENRAMIVGLFEAILVCSRQCPGRDRPQCCHATGDEPCFPNWQEREDIEWYAQQIDMQFSMLDRRLIEASPISAAIVADEAFELGCLVTEAQIKLQWDKHAQRGQNTVESAGRGGLSRRKRPGIDATVYAVDQLMAQGKRITRAYAIVAQQQGVTDQTIAKEYCKAKKQG